MSYYGWTQPAHGRGDPPVPLKPTSFDKRTDLIDRLVDTTAEIIDNTWQKQPWMTQQDHRVVSTKTFIQEILRRSRTTYSNLQLCLFYIFRIKPQVLMWNRSKMPPDNSEGNKHVICCGRRMFLASLMVAAKFLQDKNYRNRAWSHISGLPIKEINAAELAFLRLIKYDLFITKDTFDHWHQLLQSYMYRPQPSACYLSPAPSCLCFCPTPAVACSCPYSRHPSTSSALPSPPLTPPTPSSSHLINASLDLPSPFASPQFYFSFRPPCTIAYPSPPFEPGHKRPSDLSDHAHVKRHKQITLK